MSYHIFTKPFNRSYSRINVIVYSTSIHLMWIILCLHPRICPMFIWLCLFYIVLSILLCPVFYSPHIVSNPNQQKRCVFNIVLYIIKCAPFSRLSLTCARYLVPRISRLTLIGSFQVFTHRDIYVRSFAVRSLT